jgi:hypothetical protein
MDKASKSALGGKGLNILSSEVQFEAQSQDTLKRQCSEMLNETLLAAALKDESTPSKRGLWELS